MYSLVFPAFSEIHVDQSFNTRGLITLDSCFSLAEDIKARGLIQPVLLRETEKSELLPQQYALVCGYRRFTATFIINRFETIPAILNTGITKEDALLINVQENNERENLTEQQKVSLVERLIACGYSIRKVSELINKPRQWVFSYWALGQMHTKVREAVFTGQLPVEVALELYNYENITEDEITDRVEEQCSAGKYDLYQLKRIFFGKRHDKKITSSRTFSYILELLKRNKVPVAKYLKPILEWNSGFASSKRLSEELSELYPNGDWKALLIKHREEVKKQKVKNKNEQPIIL